MQSLCPDSAGTQHKSSSSIMHVFQTNNRTQSWCLVRQSGSRSHVENTPGHERLSRTCLAYLWRFWCLRVCIVCVCDHKATLMHHSQCGAKGALHLIPGSTKKRHDRKIKGCKRCGAASRRFPRKQPSDTCITLNIAPWRCCQRASDFHKEFSFEGT